MGDAFLPERVRGLQDYNFPVGSDAPLTALVVGWGLAATFVYLAAVYAQSVSSQAFSRMRVLSALSANLPERLARRILGWSGAQLRAVHALAIFLGYVLPPAILVGCAAHLGAWEPDGGCWVYGMGVVFGGAMLLCGTFAAGAWRSQRWHATTRVLAPAALCATLPLAMQLILVLQTPNCAATPELREFPYTALTALVMAANALPVVALLYLNLGDGAAAERGFTLRPPSSSAARTAATFLGMRRAEHARLQAAWLYGVSLVLLALYSAFVWVEVEEVGMLSETDKATKLAGMYTSLTVIMLDIEMWLYTRAGLTKGNPVPPLVYIVGARVALVLVRGEGQLLMVHALIFLVAGTWVGGLVATRQARENNDLMSQARERFFRRISRRRSTRR